MATRSMVTTLWAGVMLSLGLAGSAAASDILYFLSAPKGAPQEQRRSLKTTDDDTVSVALEPVASIAPRSIKAARIQREELEILDQENPVSEMYVVRFILDDADKAKLEKTMTELCKTKPGVHIVVDETAIAYYPFLACDHFDVSVPFTEKDRAEKFAKQFTQDVSFVAAKKN